MYTKAIRSRQNFYPYAPIEALRAKMLRCTDAITVTDLGTGTPKNSSRTINEIATKSLKNPRLGQLLFQLVLYFQPSQIIDLGTSLGITTMYLASAKTTAKVTSLEGCANIASYAQANFKKKGLKNIELIVGNINSTLRLTLENIPQVDFVFFGIRHFFTLIANFKYMRLRFVG